MSLEPEDLYQQGVEAHHQGEWSRAIALYHHALRFNPQSAGLHYHLGLLLDQQGRLPFAIQQYEQTLALDPQHPGAMENLGGAYFKQGHIDQAIVQLQHAIATFPSQASLWNNLGQAVKARGQVAAAIAAYQKAIQIQPDLVTAHLNLGDLWLEQGQVEQAIAKFQHVLTLDPSNLSAHSHCAQLHFQRGNLAIAVEHWRQIARQQHHLLHPYCQQVQQEQQIQQEHSTINRGRIPADLRYRARQTCAQFLQGLLDHQSVQDISQHLQQTYEHWGDLVMQDDGAPLADYYFRQALRLQPNNVSLLLKLAQALTQQQRREGAIALHTLAQTRQPNLTPTPTPTPAPTPESPPIRPYCQSTTIDWVNTTTRTPHYQPIDWPFWGRVKNEEGGTKSLATALLNVQNSKFKIQNSTQNPTQTSNLPHSLTPPLPHSPTPSPKICGGITCSPCMTHLRAKFQPYYVRPQILNCLPNGVDPEVLAPDPPFPTFVVTIAQGCCWVEPQRNSWAICNQIAVITPDRTLLADLSRSYPWFLPGCRRSQPSHHRFLQPGSNLTPGRYLDGRVALLSGLSGHIYYHWMMDILPRLGILWRGGWKESGIDAFVINSTQRPFQQQTLAWLGVPEEKMIESDRHPHLHASELIVPSFPGYLNWVPKPTVEFLRSAFLPMAPQTAPPPPFHAFPPYLYISRAKASYRRLVNEVELLQQLQPLGFEAIALETLTVRQQVALFAHAKIVVAPHGAGLTNTVFCQPGTNVVEIASPHYVQNHYWIISHHVGLAHYLVKGQTVSCGLLRQVMYQNPLTEDIWLPEHTIQSLVALLRDLIQGEHHE